MNSSSDLANISHLFFSEDEIKRIENMGDTSGLVGIIVSVYQEAVLTLTPEYWSGAHSDSIGHWWRKIGKHLGHYEDVDDNTFWEEFKQDQTTLLLEDARDIAVKTKQLITHILNEVGTGNPSPTRGSILDLIYHPSLDELSWLVHDGSKSSLHQ